MKHDIDSLKSEAARLIALLMTLMTGGEGCLAALTQAVKTLEKAVLGWLYHLAITEPAIIRVPDVVGEAVREAAYYDELEAEYVARYETPALDAAAKSDAKPPEPEIKSTPHDSDTSSEEPIECDRKRLLPDMSPRRREARDAKIKDLSGQERRLPKTIRQCAYLDLMKRLSALRDLLDDPEPVLDFYRAQLRRAGAVLPDPIERLCGREDYDPHDPCAFDEAIWALQRAERDHDYRKEDGTVDEEAYHADLRRDWLERQNRPDIPDLPDG